MKQSFKFLLFLSLMLAYIVHGVIYSLIYRDIWTFRSQIIHLMSQYSSWGLRIIGVRVRKQETLNNMKFIVSNHLSYLDVLVMSAQFPTTFVTSVEIRETLFLGFLSKLGGCLYVERRNKVNISNEIKDITLALKQNIPVTIFPEATSTNAESVLRFKRPLFQASMDAGVAVSPICINYLKIDGELLNVMNRDYVCWYGDMGFLSHLWDLMGREDILVELKLLDDISAHDPVILAEESHRRVQESFIGLSPLTSR